MFNDSDSNIFQLLNRNELVWVQAFAKSIRFAKNVHMFKVIAVSFRAFAKSHWFMVLRFVAWFPCGDQVSLGKLLQKACSRANMLTRLL